ncbi:MAG: hypothetical protein Hyperionvirus35_5 [Hyperionvirus sp.]|uniref:Leucine-rich repeat protein n=1 Tax=Hyperionvirus sp. TaxID=2487770 RepID=A0A3G5AH32_9VIRU|nr:MAG: hypothetical protein Hyperionvirus35_5 [Hyperionvirus sp.]
MAKHKLEMDFIIIGVSYYLSIFDTLKATRLSRGLNQQVHAKSIKTCVCRSPHQKKQIALKFPKWSFFAKIDTIEEFNSWNPLRTIGLQARFKFHGDLKNFPQLIDLDIHLLTSVTNNHLQHLTKLTRLSFSENSVSGDIILPPTINQLELPDWNNKINPNMLTRLTTLTNLSYYSRALTETDLKIHKNTLRRLTIYGAPLPIIRFSSVPLLTHFHSDCGAIEFSKNDDVKNLLSLHCETIFGLHHVQLTGLKYFKINDFYIKDINAMGLTSLTKLVYPNSSTKDSATLADSIKLKALQCERGMLSSFKTPSLTSLALRKYTDIYYKDVLSSFTQIVQLSICLNYSADTTPLFSLTNLTNLEAHSDFPDMNKNKFLCSHFSKLIHLSLENIFVEEKALGTMIKLQSLILKGWGTSISLKDISNLTNLVILSIDELKCDRDSLSRIFPNLETFSGIGRSFDYRNFELPD